MPTKIDCPFVYANGRRCTGHIRRAKAYGSRGHDGRLRVKKYRLWCSEKDDHAGVVSGFEGKQRMEFYPNQLPEGVEDLLWASGMIETR
jgi:hypothetical protein